MDSVKFRRTLHIDHTDNVMSCFVTLLIPSLICPWTLCMWLPVSIIEQEFVTMLLRTPKSKLVVLTRPGELCAEGTNYLGDLSLPW